MSGPSPTPISMTGIQGLKFIEACLKSQEDGNVWTQV